MEAPCPPDRTIRRFTITASTDNNGRSWFVTCPEWRYKNETNERIVEHVAGIVKAIHWHNEAQKLT